jgi:hypothetical protein
MISIGEKDQTLETDSKETTEDIVITDSQKIKLIEEDDKMNSQIEIPKNEINNDFESLD